MLNRKFIFKIIVCVILFFIIFTILFFIIKISLIVIEQYVEGNTYNVWIYNNTNENIKITINHKKINIEPKILLIDKLFFFSNERKYNYRIEINENKILEKTVTFPSEECRSYSAKGGTFTNVLINKINENNFEIEFYGDMEPWNKDKLEIKRNKRFIKIFDRDGLN